MTIPSDAARSRGAGSTDGVPRGQMLPGQSRRPWDDTTLLKVEGNFNVTGPLETFANAGGVHLARAILAEFAESATARGKATPTSGRVTSKNKQNPVLPTGGQI